VRTSYFVWRNVFKEPSARLPVRTDLQPAEAQIVYFGRYATLYWITRN
jgi:hypothetical protein